MRKLQEKFQKNELFLRIFLILLVSIILLTLVISYTVYERSKESYIRSYQQSNDIILRKVQDDYEMMNQNIQRIFTMTDDSNYVESYLTKTPAAAPQEYAQIILEMKKQLEDTREIFEGIPSNLILIGTNNQTYIQNDGLRSKDLAAFMNSDLMQQVNSSSAISFYFYVNSGLTTATYPSKGLLFVRKLQTERNHTFGYAMIFVSEEYFSSIYTELLDQAITTVQIIDTQNIVVSATDKSLLGESLAEDLQPLLTDNPPNDHLFIYNRLRLYSYNFQLINQIDKNALVSGMNVIQPTILIASLVALIVGIFSFFTLRRTTQPIYKLIHALPAVTLGDFDQKVAEEGTYETRELSKAYNLMLRDLSAYFDNLMNTEEEKRLSELQALQMQIQPHFVYNTLASIKFLIWQQKTTQATEAIDSFIALLRHTLGNKKEFVSLEEELSSVEAYITILQLRFGDEIQSTIFCDEALYAATVPKMIIQPIIENAYLHAFPEDTEGFIQIFITKDDHQLQIEIIDNGVGFDTQILSEQRSTMNRKYTGIGINNIHERIQILYGADYGITLQSLPGNGTQVRLLLPLIEQE